MLVANYNDRGGVIEHIFSAENSCQDIDTNRDTILVYEMKRKVVNEEKKIEESPPNPSELEYKDFEIMFMKQEKIGKNICGATMRKLIPRFENLNTRMSVMEFKRFMFQKLKYMYKKESEMDDDELNDKIQLQIFDNLPRQKASYYTYTKVECDLCG